jgi:hypothetical protein
VKARGGPEPRELSASLELRSEDQEMVIIDEDEVVVGGEGGPCSGR